MSDSTLAPGTILDGKWRIDAQLGKGGMGTVYAATHVRNAARVAIKVLHPEIAREAGSRERFLQEGYAANRVGHRGVVRVLDDGATQDGLVYLVMELLEGRALEAITESAPGGVLSLDEAVRYTIPWLEAVAAAHAAGIVHRDLKPENAFVCNDGVVKVLDFGLARVREAVSQKRLTTTGVPLGTPAFMPPEQALAHWDEVDARSDVYSLGASLFTMVTGQLVHDGRTVPEIIVAVSTRPARPLRTVLPSVSPPVAAVIDKALQFRREDRWSDAGAMLAALRSALVEQFQPQLHQPRATLQSSPGAPFQGDATIRMDAGPQPSMPATPRMVPVNVTPIAAAQTIAAAVPTRGTMVSGQPGRSTESPVSSGKENGRAGPSKRSSAGLFAVAAVALAGLGVGAFVLYSSPRGSEPARNGTSRPEDGTGTSGAGNVPGPTVTPTLGASSAPAAASGAPVVSASAAPSAAPSTAPTPHASTRPPSTARPPTTAKPTGDPPKKNCHIDELTQKKVCQ